MTDTERPNLLIISHAPSPNTRRLRQALAEGAASMDGVTARVLSPFDTQPEDVIAASAYILSTPENLGYMSGALKDFFDRCYYPCLDHTQGRPYLLQVRAGNDGRGTVTAVERIVTGLRWRAVQPALICRGEFREEFVAQCRELGEGMAAALEAGMI